MNISVYFTKVKNLTDVFASIRTLVDDEDLVAVTLNGLGKNYRQFRTSITIWKTFFDFQDLITVFISEEMKIVDISSNGGSQESVFYSNTNRVEVEVEVVKLHFRGRHGSSHGGHHQHESQAHGGGWGNFGGRGSRGNCGGCGGNHQSQ